MKVKVRLVCPVKLTASVEIEMDAEDIDVDTDTVIEEYKRQAKAYQAKLDAYHRLHTKYPEPPFYWSTDDDDIEANMDDDLIEIDTVEEIK